MFEVMPHINVSFKINKINRAKMKPCDTFLNVFNENHGALRYELIKILG